MSWDLPKEATFCGKKYPHKSDFREILKLLALLGDEEKPEFLRWHGALFYFFEKEIPEEAMAAAMEYLAHFLTAGEKSAPGPRLYDWQADAQLIAAGVNAVAGREVRALEYLHWWSFLGYFRSMGEGQFALVVGIRQKLRRGKRLEPHEEAFYRGHQDLVRLKTPDTAEKRRLEALLGDSEKPSQSRRLP